MGKLPTLLAIDKASVIPRYHQLYTQLRELIVSGKLKENDCLPSDNEMIAEYHLSRSTVRQAVNALVKENLVWRENGRGTFVKAFKTTAEKATMYVALFVAGDISFSGGGDNLSFYGKLRRAFDRCFEHNKLAFKLIPIMNDRRDSFDIAAYRDSSLRGAVFTGHYSHIRSKVKDCGKILGVPAVFVDFHMDSPSTVSVVGRDEWGGEIGTEHLIQCVLRRIGFIGCPDPNYVLRFKGYLAALRKNGIAFDKNLVWFDFERHIDDPSFLKNRVDALFVCGDFITAKLMSRLAYNGIKVPDDMSIVTYDDTELLDVVYPPVTCIAVDLDEMAEKTCQAILGRINDQVIEVSTRLIVRGSTRSTLKAERSL